MPRRWPLRALTIALATVCLFVAGSARADAPSSCGYATYCGGPVISNVQVVPVFWTSAVRADVQARMPPAIHQLVSSPFMDLLSEYSTKNRVGSVCGPLADGRYAGPTTPTTTGQTITRGTSTGPVTITPLTMSGTLLSDQFLQVGVELKAQIAAGHLPPPVYDAEGYPNTLYTIFFPPGISLLGPPGQGKSCASGFGGYHYSVGYEPPASCTGRYLPYAVIMDCDPAGPASELDGIVAHELSESITNVDATSTPNHDDTAWFLGPTASCIATGNCPSNCGEIGDVCQPWGYAPVPGTQVLAQRVFSAKLGDCVVANPGVGPQTPPLGAPAGTCNSALRAGVGSDIGTGTGNPSAGDPDAGTGGDEEQTVVDAGEPLHPRQMSPPTPPGCAASSETSPGSFGVPLVASGLALAAMAARARRRRSQ